jgi:Rieske 2Fe-2S family protein
VTDTVATTRWLLPAEAYWSPAWYAAEQERLFARSWNLVGTVEDLDDAQGLMATVAGSTVFIDSRGFIDSRRQSSKAAVDTWAGYVFVHLDPASAPPLSQWLDGFQERIGGFQPDRLVEVARHRFVLNANWKLFVENHIDIYHLWYLHAESLGAYDHHRATWSTCGPHWVFYEPPRPELDTHGEQFWRGLLPVRHIGEERWGSGAHLIWPNVTLATGAGFFMTYQCTPTGPERSLVDLRIRAEPGSDATDMLQMSRQVIEREDGAACQRMQAAVRSPWFSVGPLANDHERPITWFQDQVLAAMGER